MIGIVTALVCVAAIHLGAVFGKWVGSRAQMFGGIALIVIAINIVLSHGG